jgi:hypothetical protein
MSNHPEEEEGEGGGPGVAEGVEEGGRGGTSGIFFQGSNNEVELPVRCPVQTAPSVYCGHASFAEARWCGKCGSENLYYRKPYSPKPNQFVTPPRGGQGYKGMGRGGRSSHRRN